MVCPISLAPMARNFRIRISFLWRWPVGLLAWCYRLLVRYYHAFWVGLLWFIARQEGIAADFRIASQTAEIESLREDVLTWQRSHRELQSLLKLSQKEVEGLAAIIERDRARVAEETAICARGQIEATHAVRAIVARDQEEMR